MPGRGRPERSDHPLARAVFSSVYRSHEQRSLRALALGIVIIKHTARGLLFSWPLYLMVYGGFHAGAPINILLWALGIPGIGISLFILVRGIREEYQAHVSGRLHTRGNLFRLLRGGLS